MVLLGALGVVGSERAGAGANMSIDHWVDSPDSSDSSDESSLAGGNGWPRTAPLLCPLSLRRLSPSACQEAVQGERREDEWVRLDYTTAVAIIVPPRLVRVGDTTNKSRDDFIPTRNWQMA